jgi:phosphate/sulfate permease
MSSAEKIEVDCSQCGAHMRVPVDIIGRKVRCPRCTEVFRVEAPAPDEYEDDFGDNVGLLDGLDDGEAMTGPGERLCPSCSATMSADAKLCTSCGLDLRTGRAVATQNARYDTDPDDAGGISGVLASMSLAGRSLTKGVLLSAAAASLGGVAWFAIIWYLNYEIGFVAIAIGALAGAGMAAGVGAQSNIGGFLAAGIASLTIVAAKAAVFASFGSLLIEVTTLDLESDYVEPTRAAIADWYFAHEDMTIEESEAFVDGMSDEEFAEACRDVQRSEIANNVAHVNVMPEADDLSDAEFDARLEAEKRVQQQQAQSIPDDELVERLIETEKEYWAAFREEMRAVAAEGFMEWAFSPWDILFFALAIGTAFKLATGFGE